MMARIPGTRDVFDVFTVVTVNCSGSPVFCKCDSYCNVPKLASVVLVAIYQTDCIGKNAIYVQRQCVQ